MRAHSYRVFRPSSSRMLLIELNLRFCTNRTARMRKHHDNVAAGRLKVPLPHRTSVGPSGCYEQFGLNMLRQNRERQNQPETPTIRLMRTQFGCNAQDHPQPMHVHCSRPCSSMLIRIRIRIRRRDRESRAMLSPRANPD